jgi:hypothetical protein
MKYDRIVVNGHFPQGLAKDTVVNKHCQNAIAVLA